MSSEHGHCSKSSNVREDEEQDQAERRRLQSDQKVSDKDISDVVDELTRREVKKLYEKLGIKHNLADISEQDTRFQGLDSAQQAKSVLRDHWLQPKPNDATRETILQALDQCEFINSKENLEIKWQIQDHNTIDQVSETDIIDVVEILTKEEIRKVYGRLRIDHKAVEKFEGIFRDDGPDEQAKSVLRDYWLQREGKKATRRTILEAVGRCGFVKPKKNLERTWQIQDEGQDPNIAYQGCIALKPTWTSDGLLSLQPEVSGFKDGNKIEISYTYGADGYEVYTYSQLSEPHILQGVDEDWRGRVTAKASNGLTTAQCHVKVGSIKIIPSWAPKGLRLIPEVTECRISRKAEISYTYDTDDCEQSEKYLYSKKPHHLKGVKNTWSGFVTATVSEGLTIAQCQTEIEKEFDLQKFKEDIKTKYRTTLGSIISFPLNQFYHQERNIEYMYVELELEKAVRRNKELMTLSEDKAGSSESMLKITKEDLLVLKTSEGEDVRRILVKGLAGSGKSSLLTKIAYEWAQEKEQPKPRAEGSPFIKYELVFLLRMNHFENNGLLLDEICKQLSLDETMKQGLKNYINQNQSEIIILMDAWDETKIKNIKLGEFYPGNMTIEQIIASQTLEKTLVIVSSRPHKPLGSIQSKYGQVNLTGFSSVNISNYIRKFFSNQDSDKAEAMIKDVYSSEQLGTMAKVPIILMILCTIWNKDQEFPDTRFSIYNEFVTIIWEQCKHKSTTEISFQTFQRRLGEIALQGLMSEDRIEENIIEFPEATFGHFVDFGLKVGYITKGWNFTNKEESFITFLHKSVQEFFAGKYLAQLYHEGKQENFNDILKRLESWDLVLDKFEILRFCCGETLQSSDQCSLTIIGHVIRTYDTFYKSRTVSAVNTCNGCDGQSTDVTSYVDFGVLKESVSGHINSIDCLPILKLLQEAKIQDATAIRERFSDSVFVTPMSVEIEYNNSQALLLFRNFLYWADCFSTVKAIKLHSVYLLSDILSHVPNIHVLTLSLFDDIEDTIVKLCKHVESFKQLSTLNLYDLRGKYPNCLLRTLSKNRSSSTKMRHICIAIICYSARIPDAVCPLTLSVLMTEQLTCLILINTGLFEEDIEDLSGYLSRSPQLRKLDLAGNHIGNSITPLTQSLMKICRQLQILRLRNTKMREWHTQALINFLTSQLIDLIELDLSYNDVGGVITAVGYCKHLHTLKLSLSCLNADHMSAIGNLPDTLQILDVTSSLIGDGLVKLLEALQHCQKLKKIKLSNTHLTDTGVVSLGQNLHRWPRLSHLIFDDNDNIGTSGVDSILSHIHHLRELQQLYFDFNRDTVYSPLVRDCLREIRECSSNSCECDGSITVNIFESQAIQKIQHISREASQAAR